MGLLSFLKRPRDAAPIPATGRDAPDAVQQARTRARQRLIGAVVLVAIGIIGFPLVFETQPRPIPIDTPIEIPRKDGAPPLVMPPQRAATPTPAAPPRPAEIASAPADDVITESAADAGRELPPVNPPAAPAPAARAEAPKAEAKKTEAPKPDAKAEPKKAETHTAAAPTADAARAKALLEGTPATASAEAGRFVVQIGAFADANAARDTRGKVEKLGLKTYTQVAQTAAGSRIRVRVGPFASREQAEKARAQAQAAGLSAVVLTL